MRLAITEGDGIPNDLLLLLKSKFEVVFLKPSTLRTDLLRLNPEILFVRLGLYINEGILKDVEVKIIVSPTTGLSHIDLDYCKKRRIKIISLKGEYDFLKSVYSTAEHTMLLILSLLRNFKGNTWSVDNGNWNRELFVNRTLSNKIVGIIGLGRIGKMVEKYCKSFGAEVLFYDQEETIISDYGVKVSLDHLLSSSDIISIHVPYEEGKFNHHFIGSNELRASKKGSYLINTSRGGVIDENALIDLIKANHFGGVALDVLSDEFFISETSKELVALGRNIDINLIITPHIGGATYEDMRKTELFVFNKLIDYVENTF